jgi:hypothetical protein
MRETWIREWVHEHRDVLFLGTFLPSPHLFLLREVNLRFMRTTHELLPEMWAALLTGLSRGMGWVSCIAAWHMMRPSSEPLPWVRDPPAYPPIPGAVPLEVAEAASLITALRATVVRC